jgi:hypothetical protein
MEKSKSQGKAMMIICLDIRSMIMIDQVVNQRDRLRVLPKLQEWARKKMLELWKKPWILHQGNAQAHNTLAMKQFLADGCIPVITSPHSLDLAHLFLKVGSKELVFSLSMR